MSVAQQAILALLSRAVLIRHSLMLKHVVERLVKMLWHFMFGDDVTNLWVREDQYIDFGLVR